MNILITTDAFPPTCGGSGWSTYYLARALTQKGHDITVAQASLTKAGIYEREYEGINVYQFGVDYASVPLYKKFRPKGYLFPHLLKFLEETFEKKSIDIIHAQHLLTAAPSIAFANHKGIPVVCTVRDYWPICFHSTGLLGNKICPECTFKNMFSCLTARFPMMVPFSPVIVPFMRANLKFKQKMLNRADKVIAVSKWLKRKLSIVVPEEKIEVIHNFIDFDKVQEKAQEKPKTKAKEPYLLYTGKLAINKGAHLLLQIMQLLKSDIPLLVAGDGPLREPMEKMAKKHNLNMIFLDWISNEEVLRLMGHCHCLIYTTLWEEPLSRVLLEALGCGAPIAALSSGGTPEIIEHNYNGLLAKNLDELIVAIKDIMSSEKLRKKLSANAQLRAKNKFGQKIIIDQITRLYDSLIKKCN
jgi:glycosyltransferase involved in cell wall biosynthesis